MSSLKKLALVAIVAVSIVCIDGSKRVKLKDVEVLTLRADSETAARRTNPIPQLECIGGSAGCPRAALPQVVQCRNTGFDGSSVNWKCEADLDKRYRFGNLDVSCEGYDYPDDEYILAGSCGLRYSLDLLSSEKDSWFSSKGSRSQTTDDDSSNIGILFALLVVVVICFFFWTSCLGPLLRGDWDTSSHAEPSAPPAPPGFNFGDAPPPYSASDADGARMRGARPNLYPDLSGAPHTQGSSGGRSGWGFGGGSSGWKSNTASASATSGPGFWTGLATGGVAGYFAGRATAPSAQSTASSSSWSSRPTYTSPSDDSSSSSRLASGYATTSRR